MSRKPKKQSSGELRYIEPATDKEIEEIIESVYKNEYTLPNRKVRKENVEGIDIYELSAIIRQLRGEESHDES